MDCPQCGSGVSEEARFCGQCGAALPAAAPPAAAAKHEQGAGERRQLTVVFSDIVGSTALSETLDPEDYRAVVRRCHRLVAASVERYGGRVVQYLGDGVLTYFGHPRAHEDDADRAVAAALDLLARLGRRRGSEAEGPRLPSLRVGIHTGLAVVGEMGSAGHREVLAMGNTPNVAARLQTLAEADTVVIGEATRRLLRSGVACEPLGLQRLKGIREPVAAFRVLPDGGRTAAGLPAAVPITPMVNRDAEILRLDQEWRAVVSGHARTVLVIGEAGIGKSRLVRHFAGALPLGVPTLTARCSALEREQTLFPLARLLREWLGDAAREPGGLEGVVRGLGGDPEEDTPLLAGVLRLGDAAISAPPAMAPAERRRRTRRLLERWLSGALGEVPGVLVVEDLHWADPSTLEFLAALRPTLEGRPTLLLLTSRAETGLPRALGEGARRLDVERLDEAHTVELVREILDVGRIDDDGLEEVVRKTDGVPLFVEELVRMVAQADASAGERHSRGLEAGAYRLDIPSTLHDLLMARLDGLGADKRTAQWAAVIGRPFTVALLAAVSGDPDPASSLDRLATAGILERQEGGALAFRHALTRDAAYQALLRRERKSFHARVAETLESQQREGREDRPEQLAYHLTRAGLERAAAPWWQLAGERALARSENLEAIAYLRRGLRCLGRLPQTDDAGEADDPRLTGASLALRLRLQTTLAAALVSLKGYAAPEVATIHEASRETCHLLDDPRRTFEGLRATLPYYLVRSQHETARQLGNELVALAEGLGDEELLVEAHLSLATALFWLGEVALCHRHALASLSLAGGREPGPRRLRFGQEPTVLARLYAAWSAWWLGRLDTARELGRRAVEVARELGHSHTLVLALDHACSLHLYLRETEAARTLLHEQARLAGHHGFEMWSAMAGFRSAWLRCLEGELEAGISGLERGLAAFRATGAEIARPLHLSYLAQGLGFAGRFAEGLAALDEGLEAVEHNRERHWQPELHRLRGELLRRSPQGDREAARRALEMALEMARQRGSPALELRAAASLLRLDGGRVNRERLTRAVAGFDDRADGLDVVEARRLLVGPC